MDIYQLIEAVRQWGVAKGITGPEGKGTLLGQLDKTLEEYMETRDAAVLMENVPPPAAFNLHKHSLKDGIGDTTVTLILAAELAGLDFTDCLQAAYDVISKRTGKMVGGVFVKDGEGVKVCQHSYESKKYDGDGNLAVIIHMYRCVHCGQEKGEAPPTP